MVECARIWISEFEFIGEWMTKSKMSLEVIICFQPQLSQPPRSGESQAHGWQHV